MKVVALVLLGLLALASADDRKSYDGYKVLRIQVESKSQADILSRLDMENVFDFWNNIRTEGPVDIMTSPEKLSTLEKFLERNQMSYSVMIEDVQKLADMSPMQPGKPNNKQGHNMDWESYHPLDDMYGFFDYLEGNIYTFLSFIILPFDNFASIFVF